MRSPSTGTPASHVFIGRRRIDQAAIEAGAHRTPPEPVAIIAPAGTPAERRRERQRQAVARDA